MVSEISTESGARPRPPEECQSSAESASASSLGASKRLEELGSADAHCESSSAPRTSTLHNAAAAPQDEPSSSNPRANSEKSSLTVVAPTSASSNMSPAKSESTCRLHSSEAEKASFDIYPAPARPDPLHLNPASDLEKAEYHYIPSPPMSSSSGWHVSTPATASHRDWDAAGDVAYEQHLGLILFHLSASSPFVALLVAFYSIFMTLILIVLSPISLCTKAKTFNSIPCAIAPAILMQLKLIHSTSARSFHADAVSTARLLAVALLSPFYAFAIMLASWVAATFWLFAAIIGEPDPSSGGEEQDGRAAARSVRKAWQCWLRWGVEQV